jgi:hypothetical protein
MLEDATGYTTSIKGCQIRRKQHIKLKCEANAPQQILESRVVVQVGVMDVTQLRGIGRTAPYFLSRASRVWLG